MADFSRDYLPLLILFVFVPNKVLLGFPRRSKKDPSCANEKGML